MSKEVNLPNEPLTSLGESAAALHELYVSLVQGGFTVSEALQLVALVVINGNGDESINEADETT